MLFEVTLKHLRKIFSGNCFHRWWFLREEVLAVKAAYAEVHTHLPICHPPFLRVNHVPVTASLVLMGVQKKVLNLFISADSWQLTFWAFSSIADETQFFDPHLTRTLTFS